jgi:hypothetical protein
MDEFDEQIIVYDDYKISLYKYPRRDTEKEYTDIIITIYLMHEDFLKKLAKSFEYALQFYHECKEYYYIFNFNKEIRKYSAQEIILIQKSNPNNLSRIDCIFYYYLKNKDFYLNLYESMEHAKRSYFDRREYNYRISPPIDFYNNIFPKTYNALELMELNSYAQYLIKRKIIQDLPKPKYIK